MTMNSPGTVRGKLTARGRDVPRITIHAELGDDLRFVPTEAPTTAPNARARILEALERRPGSTAQEIASETGIPVATVKNVLTVLARDTPPSTERTGTGRRDAPFRYSIASRFRPAGMHQDGTGMQDPDTASDLNHPDTFPRDEGRDDSNSVSQTAQAVSSHVPSAKENGRDDSNIGGRTDPPLRSTCVSCGGALEPGQRVRCADCVTDAYHAREAGR